MPSAEDCATLQSYIQTVDQTARTAEQFWGLDRLQTLVDQDLRAKFERQRVKWRAALEDAFETERCTRPQMQAAQAASAAMSRAWAALDQDARANDHEPIKATVWELKLADGKLGAFVKTVAEAASALAGGRYAVVWTVDEVGAIIDALPRLLNDAKVAFLGAQVIRSAVEKVDRSWVKDGDEIPF